MIFVGDFSVIEMSFILELQPSASSHARRILSHCHNSLCVIQSIFSGNLLFLKDRGYRSTEQKLRINAKYIHFIATLSKQHYFPWRS